MPRSIWKGAISFGLVNIPVALYPAEESDELSFSLLDRRDMAPIGYRRINKTTEETVPSEEIVRGYQLDNGEYVILTDEDLKKANVEATQTVDIVDFVEGAEIAPLFYNRPYYLEPQKKGQKGYVLLRETLRKTGKVGIAKVVIRTRQHVAAVMEKDGVLLLDLLRYAHELRDPKELDIPAEDFAAVNLSDKELDMARRLVEGMVEPWQPDKYNDTYRDDLMAFIEKKAKAGDSAVAAEPEPAEEGKGRGQVVDLMPLLKKSLEEAERGRPARARSKAPAEVEEAPRRQAVAKAARGKGRKRAS